ncbi:MAG: glycoside hydrolase family 9 protein [Bacteroidales bacterium]
MKKLLIGLLILWPLLLFSQNKLTLNDDRYFEMQGLNVTFFSDFYPEGHQSGVTIIQHGNRVAANGDLRLEASPGQWSPIPAGGEVKVDRENNSLSKRLWYPDSSKNRRGFNPIIYPDLELFYEIRVQALDGAKFRVTVDLDEPLPDEWVGKVGFNLELFPGDLFGKYWIMDEDQGIFPIQPVGPLSSENGEHLTEVLAKGKELIIAPGNELQKIKITSRYSELELRDGRSNHNNGWYIVRSIIPAGKSESAMEWIIEPNVVKDWLYEPIIQVSQLGYHPGQEKIAIIERDKNDDSSLDYKLYKIEKSGKKEVKTGFTNTWGLFLRYKYDTINFTDIQTPGIYQIEIGDELSPSFEIAEGVYSKNTWQTTLEYFLPVQMCHMRVNEKYRVWHDICHMDDALMAPLNHNHFDGYRQGSSTLTAFKPGDHIPGLNQGGWHDAGDYDLRVESQMGTVWMLALMIEEFGLDHDATMIDPENKIVEIHEPDGKNDAIQQIEHGLASVLGAYRSLGRLYRGIIASDLRQYVMLGDAASMTDNIIWDTHSSDNPATRVHPSQPDDRWVFTENNPTRELLVAGRLAAASRVLVEENPELSKECLEVSLYLFENAKDNSRYLPSKIFALTELSLTTGDNKYIKMLISHKDEIIEDLEDCGWMMGRVIHMIENKDFKGDISNAVEVYQQKLHEKQNSDSPYGVPYEPKIWGAGWEIQQFGVEQYFYYKGWPELTDSKLFEHSLNFILGVHPGVNNSSFVSGVGSESVTVAYGVNRADWSFIPGGVASGTALIRPDLPELKTWPFFWQQTEYVMGGGATNFMFLVLAVNSIYN